MDNFRQPNFIARRWSSLRLLQTATGLVFVLCIILSANLLAGRSSSSDRRAAIGTLKTDTAPSESSQGTASTRRPKAYSRSGMNSVASGLGADSVRYYDEQSGAAFSTDLRTGRTTTLSENRLLGFVRTLWVPGKEQVVSLFEAKGTREYRWYDYRTGTVVMVAQDAESMALSPDGRSVAYVSSSEGSTTVSVTNLDTKISKVIFTTRIPSPVIAWPLQNLLLLTYHRHDRAGYDMVTVGTDGLLNAFLSDRENLEYILSPDGRRMLFSYYTTGQGIRLAYMDIAAPTEYALGVGTSARKCAWHSGNTRITCGVPANAEMSRDVPSEMMATTDDIVTINIETSEQTKVFGAEPKTPLGIIDPVITPSGKFLSFINLFDRRLYSVEL